MSSICLPPMVPNPNLAAWTCIELSKALDATQRRSSEYSPIGMLPSMLKSEWCTRICLRRIFASVSRASFIITLRRPC
ncbi:hypothetical protein GOP47_0014751 [Adiantum capillus-veneris]|uniref:Uncharacterized protein n=2 Tax=Adiantum capillus-veneris TaxID=13818 RepID=A0A9D4UM35_ADICA|nr:hypothetical protein GOP47_0014751 [Adiantum capillus-veneris]